MFGIIRNVRPAIWKFLSRRKDVQDECKTGEWLRLCLKKVENKGMNECSRRIECGSMYLEGRR